MIATTRAAMQLLGRERVLPMSRLVAEIAGAPVKGSWWSHPAGAKIYAIASALEESPDVLVAKLIDEKVTFVHRALFAPLVRVVTDAAWRRAAARGLDAAARALLGRVERRGELRLDLEKPPVDRRARVELERRALVASSQVHTEAGRHATVLRSWTRWASPEVRDAAAGLELDAARATLASAGITL